MATSPVMVALAAAVAVGGGAPAAAGCLAPDWLAAGIPADAREVAALIQDRHEVLLDEEQIASAAQILAAGGDLGVPARGQIIALATAMQESSLRNLEYGDRDSLGLFQQRSSQGWGSAQEIQDPTYASTRFYRALLEVAGWQEMPLAVAAQRVQRSAYPDAYARWESLAVDLHAALVPTAADDALANCATPSGVLLEIPAGELPAGYQIPAGVPGEVAVAIHWALAQLGTPYQWGGTCTAPRGPDPMGRCDCSSLMQAAYRAAGVSISRTTYTQIHDGQPVAEADIRPGDLVLTGLGPDGPDHVGMALGQGLVVHAPRTGDVVKVSRLQDWAGQISYIRRIVP
ncbi:C40 family peptidase [Streptomyces triticirhizae]